MYTCYWPILSPEETVHPDGGIELRSLSIARKSSERLEQSRGIYSKTSSPSYSWPGGIMVKGNCMCYTLLSTYRQTPLWLQPSLISSKELIRLHTLVRLLAATVAPLALGATTASRATVDELGAPPLQAYKSRGALPARVPTTGLAAFRKWTDALYMKGTKKQTNRDGIR